MNNILRLLTISLTTKYFALITCGTALAQVPQGIPYQAIARNAAGVAIANTVVKVRFSIRDSIATGPVRYQETHTPTTSALGLFSVNVGAGTVVSGSFSGINWGKNAKFLQVELDPAGGNTFTNLGTTQMMSVPYALYSKTSGSSTPGPEGPAGTNGKTILNGTSNPSQALGVVGDFYINTVSDSLFGPKSNSGWGSGISLVGPKGSFPSGSNYGDMQFWDGNQWMVIPIGQENQILTIRSGKPMWINNSGGSYGEVSDIDGNTYKTVKIGNQIWMAEDLRASKFSNGEPIPTNISNWNTTNQPAFRRGEGGYNNNIMVGYYNFYAITDSRNLCPIGWRVPSENDFIALVNFVGEYPGTKLRSSGFSNWLQIVPSNTGETYGKKPVGGGGINLFGFSANGNGYYTDGTSYDSYGRVVHYGTNQFDQNGRLKTLWIADFMAQIGTVDSWLGISVRCIKN